jgi:hypothetical protein
LSKGATIAGKSSIASKKVDIEITEGTAPFTVFVNGTEQFQTTDSNFSLELNEGGLIEVATAKACEGVYAKKVKTTEILGTFFLLTRIQLVEVLKLKFQLTKRKL